MASVSSGDAPAAPQSSTTPGIADPAITADPVPATTATALHTWLHADLASAGFSDSVIQDCEQNLVQRHAFHSKKMFLNLPRRLVHREHLEKMGIQQVAVQQALSDMHGWALCKHVCCVMGLFFVLFGALVGLCAWCNPKENVAPREQNRRR